MNTNTCLHNDEFAELLKSLPDDREAAATRLGVLTRKRQIRNADTLLRLALAYSWLDLSLRNVVAWAQQQGIVQLADVSLLERLQKAVPFLAWLLMRVLQTKTQVPVIAGLPYRVRIIDATVICEPGSKGTDWRIHMDMNLSTQSIGALEVTDNKGGESFTRFEIQPEDLLVGDRAYATRSSICHVDAAGGYVLVRFAWQNLPLQNTDGTPFDLIGNLSNLTEEGQTSEWNVRTAPTADLRSVTGRVIAVRKTQAACEAARRTAIKNAKKKGHTPDARTLLTCDYLLLFTTVAASVMEAAALVRLYRYRWQIECGFKRMKSLFCLDGLRAKNDALCQAYLYSKLLGALLTDQCTGSWAAFSPWGGPEHPSNFTMASPANGLVDAATGGVGNTSPGRLGPGARSTRAALLRPTTPQSP